MGRASAWFGLATPTSGDQVPASARRVLATLTPRRRRRRLRRPPCARVLPGWAPALAHAGHAVQGRAQRAAGRVPLPGEGVLGAHPAAVRLSGGRGQGVGLGVLGHGGGGVNLQGQRCFAVLRRAKLGARNAAAPSPLNPGPKPWTLNRQPSTLHLNLRGEVDAFSGTLKPHQRALLPDHSTVLGAAGLGRLQRGRASSVLLKLASHLTPTYLNARPATPKQNPLCFKTCRPQTALLCSTTCWRPASSTIISTLRWGPRPCACVSAAPRGVGPWAASLMRACRPLRGTPWRRCHPRPPPCP
jgi:hypothetical protein